MKWLLILVFLSSCSNYMIDQGNFFSKFRRAEFEQAAELIEERSERPGRDQILFLLDRGAALFEAGMYEEAIESFSKAERLTQLKDLTSVSEEFVSIITSDEHKEYYPLDYELIMINVYLALSYYSLGNYEAAMVECRRIDNLIEKLKNRGMKSFQELAFARYLSGLIYESQKKYNEALIDYRRVMELEPGFTQSVFDAYRMARLIGAVGIARDIEQKYPDIELRQYYSSLCLECAELVIIYAAGEIPIKRPQRHNSMLPEFRTRTFATMPIMLYSDQNEMIAESSQILDLEYIARKNLEERIGIIVARRMLGVGAKVAVGYGVARATKNENLGILAGLLLHSTTRADTRSWSTLPKSISVARVTLPKGRQKIFIKGGVEDEKRSYLSSSGKKFLWLRSF